MTPFGVTGHERVKNETCMHHYHDTLLMNTMMPLAPPTNPDFTQHAQYNFTQFGCSSVSRSGHYKTSQTSARSKTQQDSVDYFVTGFLGKETSSGGKG